MYVYVTLNVGVRVDRHICGCLWVCVCVLKKDITGIKEHEAERRSKSRGREDDNGPRSLSLHSTQHINASLALPL